MTARKIILIVTIVAGLGTAGYAGFRLWPDITSLATELGLQGPASGPVTTLAVMGDNHGPTEIYQQILRDAAADKPAALINLSDTSEHGTADEFSAVKTMEATAAFPVIHVVGSHDIKTDLSRQTFIEAFGRQPCTSVDVGHVRVFLLDNADRKVGFSEDCLRWFETALDETQDRTIVVAYHRPFDLPFGDILGDDETAVSRSSNLAFRAILKRHSEIAQILTAHLHTYLPYSLEGIPAVVTGGGGDPAQSVLGGSANNYFHYLLMTVRGKTVDIQVHRVALTD